MMMPPLSTRVALLAAVVSAVFVLPLAGCATTSGGTSQAAELAAITEFNKKYLGSINDGDIATLSSLTTEGHIMITPGRPPIVGKKLNDEANGRAFQNFNIVETWTPIETVIAKSGELAFQRGTYTGQSDAEGRRRAGLEHSHLDRHVHAHLPEAAEWRVADGAGHVQ